ncbi:MAG TPA: 6-pyruvoyl-tetrahydropterin synthase-related protein [Patescibacteria group bacterium]|nr:6-pyruvoyl-tetrahydropterin synthase-related protein [Patescibacteria group bacterium]
MKIKKYLPDIVYLAVYFILGLLTILPFFKPGFFAFHDDVQVSRFYEMGQALISGQFPVRWVGDLGYGFGYPIFNFYSVLPYYIGGFINVFGADALIAAKTVFVIGILLSGLSMFFLIKEFFGRLPALVASIAYLYFPYHAVNIYVRGDLAELFAYAILPLVFLGLLKIHYSKANLIPKAAIIILSLSLFALIISHNLSALMMGIFITIFVVVSLVATKNKEIYKWYLISFLIAFLLSAFYTIPVLFEMKYTNVLSQVGIGGGSNYKDHFLCINQLWNSPWGFGGSTKGCIADGLSFRLGKIYILLTLISIALAGFYFKKIKDKAMILFISIAFLLFSIFMTLEVSGIIWSIPYMNFLQFPWRFLNFAGLFMATLIGISVYLIEKVSKKEIYTIVAGLMVIGIIFFNAKLFAPQEYLNREASYYTNKYYLNWTASKISDEYLPKNFKKPTNSHDVWNYPFEAILPNGNLPLPNKLVTKTPTDLVATTNLANNFGVVAKTPYFPAWNIYIDGKKVNYKIKNGEMYFSLPAGPHKIEIRFEQTRIELLGDLLTVIGVVAISIVIINKSKFYGRKTS